MLKHKEKERYSGSAADSLGRGSTTLASGARDGFLQADVIPTAAHVTLTRPSPPECKGMRESRGHVWGAGQASCSPSPQPASSFPPAACSGCAGLACSSWRTAAAQSRSCLRSPGGAPRLALRRALGRPQQHIVASGQSCMTPPWRPHPQLAD